MKYFKANSIGRTFIISLEQGDYLCEKILELTQKEEIENAVIVSGIATFDEVNLRMATTLGYPIEYHVEHLEEPLELASLDGTIVNSELHIHGVISNVEKAWAGHLLDGCKILYLAEIVIQEILCNKLTRKANNKNVFLISDK